MSERVKLVLELERRGDEAQGGRTDMSELCRRYGVSRPTGYVWIDRSSPQIGRRAPVNWSEGARELVGGLPVNWLEGCPRIAFTFSAAIGG
jgi:transposase-like protein